MSTRKENADHIRKHASRQLRINLRILSVVYVVLFLFTAYEVVVSRTIFYQVIIAIVIGLVAGLISARMYKITWNHRETEVVGRIDIYGVVILVLFALFELNRNHVAELFADAASLSSISLVLITSALFGRLIGTAKKNPASSGRRKNHLTALPVHAWYVNSR